MGTPHLPWVSSRERFLEKKGTSGLGFKNTEVIFTLEFSEFGSKVLIETFKKSPSVKGFSKITWEVQETPNIS